MSAPPRRRPRLPLADVRVLDLGDASAAFCGTLLADLGAAVVRDGFDRRRGVDADLALGFDAVIVSGRPSELARCGLEPARLLERHPRLIVAVVSPFGLYGPRAEWRSSDTVAQALGGMVHVNGHRGEPPLRALGPQAHHCAGLQAAIGIALALLVCRRGGGGQIVDVSVHESVVGALEHVTGLFHDQGTVAERQGTLHWSGTCRVAAGRDGPVLLSHAGDWTALIEWVKSDGAAQDLAEPRWADADVRRAECAHVFAVLERWASRYRVAELVEQAQLRRLPFAPVWPLARVAEHPQLRARGFFGSRGPFAAAFDGDACAAAHAGPASDRTGAGAARRVAAHPAAPLHGIRVLDFTWVVAGPVATRLLADHGADVIKVERLDAPGGAERDGALFANLHRGKRSLALNLGDARGVALARQLVRRCDVVIDNFSPRVMANWGLDHAALRARAPRLVAVSLSGFGATGPLADAVSYGPTLQAQTGFTWHMRHPGGAPAGWGFAYSDMVSGACAALAVLAALHEREGTGRGRGIDLAQLEVLAAMVGPLLDQAARGEPVPDALGNRSPARDAAPDGVYRCRDDGDGRERWCAIAVAADDWRRFAAALGTPAWTAEARFASAAGRVAHADELDRRVESWTRERSADTVALTLQAAGIAAGVVADARDLAGDPQLAARGYWAALPAGLTVDGVVARLSATPTAVRAPAPRLGQHTDEVLRDLLGMEQSAIDRLRGGGVVG